MTRISHSPSRGGGEFDRDPQHPHHYLGTHTVLAPVLGGSVRAVGGGRAVILLAPENRGAHLPARHEHRNTLVTNTMHKHTTAGVTKAGGESFREGVQDLISLLGREFGVIALKDCPRWPSCQ